MSLGRRLLVVLLSLLAAGVLVLGWLSRHSFQRKPVSIEVGLRGEALENPTLLLQKWLEASWRPTQRKGGAILNQELPEKGTLLLLHLSQPISASEVEVLLKWVGRGGHLLTDGTAAPFNDERGLANLHKALGVTVKNLKSDELDLLPETKHEGEDTFQPGEIPYRVRRSTRWRLMTDQPKDWKFSLGHDHAKGRMEVLLSRPEGLGRLTLTPDLSFLYRENLAEQDHADYLERILALHPERGPVVVWSRPMELSLFTWLWGHAWAFILALLALVTAWLWKGWSRFGPLVPVAKPHRRSMLEHLSASARLIWWGGSETYLVARIRQAVEKRAQRLNPSYGSLDLGGRADWLAQATGAHPDAIAAALDDRPGRTIQHLAYDLLTLERLRQRL